MGSPEMLNTIAEIERITTIANLKALLTDTVDESEYAPYSEMLGNQPHLAPLGDMRDALDRIGTDHAASEVYAVSMMCSALVKIVRAQEVRIEALENACAGRSGAGTKK